MCRGINEKFSLRSQQHTFTISLSDYKFTTLRIFSKNDNAEWMVAKIFFIARTLWWQKKKIIDPAKNSREILQFCQIVVEAHQFITKSRLVVYKQQWNSKYFDRFFVYLSSWSSLKPAQNWNWQCQMWFWHNSDNWTTYVCSEIVPSLIKID